MQPLRQTGRTREAAINHRGTAHSAKTALLILATAIATTAVWAALGFQAGAKSDTAAARFAVLEARAKTAESRLQMLEDIEKIEKLQRAYGY
jgi:hypothetical protein